MRALKVTGIVVGVLLGLVAVAALLLLALFDPNDYKDEAEAAFLRASGRNLRLEGELAVSVFPWLAVETGSASIANRDGFGRESFASLEKARVGVRLWPLLTERRIEVGRVRVDGLRVHLQVGRDGTDNWSDVLDHLSKQAADESTAAGAPAKTPASLSIASLQLTNSQLTFDDRQAGTRYSIDGWNFETGRLERGRPVDVHTSLAITRNGRSFGDVDLRAAIDMTQPDTVKLAAVEGMLRLAGFGPNGAGLPVEVRAPQLSMDTAKRAIKADELEAKVADAVLKASLQVRQGKDGPTVRGPLQLVETNPRRLLEALGAKAPSTRDATALRRLSATSQLRYSAHEGIRLTSLDVLLDGSRWTGDLAIPDLERRTLRFRLHADQLNVDRYLPPPAATSPPPPASAPVTTSGGSGHAGLRALDLQGSLDVGTLVLAAVTLLDVKIKLAAHDGRIRADPVEARAFGGRTSTRLNLDVRGDVPLLRVEESFRDVDVAAMLAQLIDVKQLEGRGRADIKLQLAGEDATAMLRSARGEFDMTVENGALVGADLWHEIEKAVAGAQLGSGPVGRGTGRTSFTVLNARGTLADRTLRNERLEFVSDFARVTGNGKVDFGANKLNLDLTARLLKVPEGRMLGVKASRIAGADIPLEVTGRIDEPQVRPDVNALLGAAARSVVTDPLEGKLRRKLEKLLGR
jgi:AsmA protein